MKSLLALFSALLLAAPASAQVFEGRTLSAELGLGAAYSPDFPGAEDMGVGPWFIWRNVSFSRGSLSDAPVEGFSVAPAFRYIGKRDGDDFDNFRGVDEVSAAYEVGARFSYTAGPVTGYAALRHGFGGHHGITGELGARYRTEISDRLTLWSGVGVEFGNDEYVDTYFRTTPSITRVDGTALDSYDPDGGVTQVNAAIEARYAISDTTAVVGEVRYGRLTGDAADSPLTEDRDQPSIRLGVTRRFSFGF